MEETHVNLLQDFYDALNGDDIESAVGLCDPDVRVWLNPDVVAALPPRGHKEVANYLRGWFDSWDAYRAQPDEFKQSGDQVVVMVQLRARGKGSRFDIEEEMADVFTLVNGKITQLRLYVDRGVALDAAGIPE
jgi:ketosteroid isomerase-like protein